MDFYQVGNSYVLLGGPDGGFEHQVKMAVAAGVRFITFPLYWPLVKTGSPADWHALDVVVEQVLAIHPRTLLIPRISVELPAWWLAAHPDCVAVWNPSLPQRHAVTAAPEFRRDAAQSVQALVAHLEEKFGTRIAGYHLCAQNTGEWFYPEAWHSALSGYAKADEDTWRQWLRDKYHDDTALSAAWKNPRATLAAVVVPPPSVRLASPAGTLRDPQKERLLLDFAQYRQEAMADCICELARAARQASGGRKLVLFFYGYLFELAPCNEGPAKAGHYALRRVLNSPDIDILCAPISYFDRGLGQSAPVMTAAESVALAGKMWLNEDDTRTYLGSGDWPGVYDAVKTLEETNQELLRNTAQCALRNFATWWMDLGATGWFDDPGMWEQMRRLDILDQALLKQSRPFRPEVAAVIDEQAMLGVAAGGAVVVRPGVYEARRPLGRIGAPCGYYMQDDVLAGKVKAKMFVLLTSWYLNTEQRQQLRAATRDALRLWCYAPGYYAEQGASLMAMHDLTGFQFKQLHGVKAWVTPTDAGRRVGMQTEFGVPRAITPLFAVTDAQPNDVLATYPDGSAAVVLRRGATDGDLFIGAPGFTSELLRVAARQAGVHLFTQRDCNVYANGPYVLLHAVADGRLEINTGRAGPVRDLLTGEQLGVGPVVFWDAKFGTTKLLVAGE